MMNIVHPIPMAVGPLIRSLPPLPASLLLLSTGVGALVLVSLVTIALVPVLMAIGFAVALVLSLLLLGWAGLEALAAIERWMERDPRFHR